MKSFLQQIKKDYPDINFIQKDYFKFSYPNKEIFYDLADDNFKLYLLHEVAHAELRHEMYKYDLELLNMERQAWELVKNKLAKKYKVSINQELIEQTLDSYRNWLYERSSCPRCGSVSYQDKKTFYHCLDCNHKWQNK